MAFEIPKPVKPIFDFTVQVVIGAFGFMVVFGAAVTISAFVKLFDGIVPHWVQTSGEYAEIGLFAMDLFCFGLFVVSEAVKMIRSLWDEWRMQ